MALKNFRDAHKLEADWDRLMAQIPGPNDGSGVPARDVNNPYIAQRAVADEGPERSCNEDENLITAYALLNSSTQTDAGLVGGFAHPIAQLMAAASEAALPHTINRLFMGLESTRQANSWAAQELKEQIRGMVMLAYAWGYVMQKTGTLDVHDESIYGQMLAISAAPAHGAELARLTAAAENHLPQTVGMLLHAMDGAAKKGQANTRLFFQGSLYVLYSLANASFGVSAPVAQDPS